MGVNLWLAPAFPSSRISAQGRSRAATAPCRDGREKTHWQPLWLLTRPDHPLTPAQAAKQVGLTPSWARTILKRWNADGPAGLADRGKATNGGQPKLTPDQQAELLDNAGWHAARRLADPPNVTLHPLPSGTPELQPAEPRWPLVREAVANKGFAELAEMEPLLIERCRCLIDHPEAVRFAWAAAING
jgi:hypothetical protein